MLVAAAFILIALVTIFFLPSLPLQEKSGLQAMADEAEQVGGVSRGSDEEAGDEVGVPIR
jgi:hypothetical protein